MKQSSDCAKIARWGTHPRRLALILAIRPNEGGNDPRPGPRGPRRRGYSLVEVLIAMVVLGIILLTLISVFALGYNLIARTQQTALATQICQAEVERIRGLTFASLASLTSTFMDTRLAGLVSGQGLRAVEAGPGADIKKLTVSVTWMFRGQSMRKDIVTYITRMGVNKK